MNEHVIEVIARAIITDEGNTKILFCAPKSLEYFYLPGGHVEFGETAESALVRELFEETGADASEAEFCPIGTVENIFTQMGVSHHEINLLFEVKGVFPGNEEVPSSEEEIVFQWHERADIPTLPVFPEKVKEMLSQRKNETEFFTRN